MSTSDRQDADNNKYKLFRNYMVNELGITRQDIEAWTKQSVANEVQKLVGGINIDEIVNQSARAHVNNALGNTYSSGSALVNALATKLAKNLTIKVDG